MGDLEEIMVLTRVMLSLVVLAIVATAIPLTSDSSMTWAEELISMHSTPTAPSMSPEALALMTNRILVKANAMRRRLNELEISDADAESQIDERFSRAKGELGEGSQLESQRLEAVHARACIDAAVGCTKLAAEKQCDDGVCDSVQRSCEAAAAACDANEKNEKQYTKDDTQKLM